MAIFLWSLQSGRHSRTLTSIEFLNINCSGAAGLLILISCSTVKHQLYSVSLLLNWPQKLYVYDCNGVFTAILLLSLFAAYIFSPGIFSPVSSLQLIGHSTHRALRCMSKQMKLYFIPLCFEVSSFDAF